MKHGPGLTFRFLAAQVVVVVISLLVAAAVATIVGPTLFHDHMLMTGREDPSLELFHAEQAYRDAQPDHPGRSPAHRLVQYPTGQPVVVSSTAHPPAGPDARGRLRRRWQLPGTRPRGERRPGGEHAGTSLQHHG